MTVAAASYHRAAPRRSVGGIDHRLVAERFDCDERCPSTGRASGAAPLHCQCSRRAGIPSIASRRPRVQRSRPERPIPPPSEVRRRRIESIRPLSTSGREPAAPPPPQTLVGIRSFSPPRAPPRPPHQGGEFLHLSGIAAQRGFVHGAALEDRDLHRWAGFIGSKAA